MCPSGKCQEGAILLGIVQSDGLIGFLDQKLYVNKEFVQIAKTGRSPEKRFRFSHACMNNSCEQWANDHCTVMEKIFSLAGSIKEPASLPSCSIRSQCRWYLQHGGRACSVCPWIITDAAVEVEQADEPS